MALHKLKFGDINCLIVHQADSEKIVAHHDSNNNSNKYNNNDINYYCLKINSIYQAQPL